MMGAGIMWAMELVATTNKLKFLGRPLNVWLAWAALVYSFVLAVIRAINLVAEGREGIVCALPDVLVAWPILIAAMIALARRRLFGRLLGGMALAFLLYHSIARMDPAGMVLAPLGFWGLVASRRWFDERLHRMGW